ncbi:PHD finger protein 14-like [Stegodyphus dumicola]|uniref:PHD finger protein 14-like n=1 Tax=Stegodyphus dumicola TaxID=202533 RepID=UPI0015A88DAB|nr:PHD finger protein 14-like [Stegodyphus dumicola]
MEPNSNDNMAEQDALEGTNFLYRTMVVRDPSKRKVKPVENHMQLLDFGDLDDSSDDSDFEIGDDGRETNEESGESSAGNDDNSEEEGEEEDGEQETEDNKDTVNIKTEPTTNELAPPTAETNENVQRQLKPKLDEIPTKKLKVLICSVCLGDVSLLPRQGSEKMMNDEEDEIVECDCCGISVHEGCYGISDAETAVTTDSLYSTEPWFCDACKAGNMNPACELCPNTGGIFKETDVGKWVHLVCALYIPGVAFGDVDKLSPVTLFEMPYSRWGAKACFLCEDDRFSRTGVCINCDAGMCRNYFHVTCAQKEGLLSKASTEEDIADPFFAYCKLHSDKNISRSKRRNYLALQSQAKEKHFSDSVPSEEKSRIERKLAFHRDLYVTDKEKRPQPWVPTQKMPRLLTTSPSACKKLIKKAELLGLSPQIHLSGVDFGMDIRRKWHVPPAFSAEFVSYYLDRNVRMVSMQRRLDELLQQNSQLQEQEQGLRQNYERLVAEVDMVRKENAELTERGMQYWKILCDLSNKKYPVPDVLQPKPILKSNKNKKSDSSGSVIMECSICHKSHDQHQLAKCDSCQLHYHLACLDPPLSRMPKKTKSLGWQCSECDKTEEEEQHEDVDANAPRKLRYQGKEILKSDQEKPRRGRSCKKTSDDNIGSEEKGGEIWISSGAEDDHLHDGSRPRSDSRRKRRSAEIGYRKSRRRSGKRKISRENWGEEGDPAASEGTEVKTPRHSTRRTSST